MNIKDSKVFRCLEIAAILVLAFSITIEAFAKDTFFSMDVGTVQTYAQKNTKGKIESQWRSIIKDVKTSGNETTISYMYEILDKKGKSQDPPQEMPCKVIIKDDIIYFDMNEAFASMKQNMPTNDVKMEITGVPIELISNLQPGQTIKDADMTMSMDLGIMKMKTVVKITDGKCLAIEDVTTPAGTFKCHKITQTSSTTVMGKNMKSTTITWYALGSGMVKTESYDEDNELQNAVELIQVAK